LRAFGCGSFQSTNQAAFRFRSIAQDAAIDCSEGTFMTIAAMVESDRRMISRGGADVDV
jgi:hypothetical protein